MKCYFSIRKFSLKTTAIFTAAVFIFSGIPMPASFANTNELTLNEAQRPVSTLTLEQANAQTPVTQRIIPSGAAVQNENPLSLVTPNLQTEENPIPEGAIQVHEGESIQAAIELARSGDTVYVHAGTYHETITLKQGVNLQGEDRETTILDGQSRYQDVILAQGDNRIEGLTITGGAAYNGGPTSAVRIEGNNIWFRGNSVINNGGYGVYLRSGDHITIERSLFTNNNLAIQHPHSAVTDVLIQYNTMVSNGIAINILDGVTPRIENNIITGSTFCAIYEFNWNAYAGGQSSSGFASVSNNVFFSNAWRPTRYGSSTPPAVADLSAGNMTADPQFTDPANGDYSVPETSPAFGRGAFLPGILEFALDRAISIIESHPGVTCVVEEIRSGAELTGWRFTYSEGSVETFDKDGTKHLDTTPPAIVVLSATTPTNKSAYQLVYTVDEGLPIAESHTLIEGANTLTVTAADIFGNQATENISVTLDTVVPVVVIDPATKHITNAMSFTIHYTVDGDEKIQLFENLDEGANTLTITETDLAGNETIVTWLLTVDTARPFILATEWSKISGGLGLDSATAVQQTSDGGYVMAGQTASFGAGAADAWLLRKDSNGNKLWEKSFGGSGDDFATSVQQTSDGGYIIGGYTASSGAGQCDFWLIKTDSSGNKLWEKTFGGPANDFAYSVLQASDGGYVIGGTSHSGVSGAVSSYVWLVKTDSNGDKLWDKKFGGGTMMGWEIQQASDGGYIIAADTYSYSSGTASWDVWFIKTDSNGNKLWDKTFGGTGYDRGRSVQQTSDGGYILAGETDSSGAGGTDFWLIKTDSLGNKLWDKTFGGPNTEIPVSVQQTTDGGYIVAGWTNSLGAGNYDWYLVKTDSDGNKLWGQTFGGSGNDYASTILQTLDGGYIVAGSKGGDAWLIKLKASSGSVVTVNAGLINVKTLTVSYVIDGVAKIKTFTDLSEGANTRTIIETDLAGNETTINFNVTVDTIAPVVVIDVNTPSLIKVKTLTVSYTLDGVAKTKLFEGLVEGENTLTITETDLAGNQTIVPWTLTVDTSASAFTWLCDGLDAGLWSVAANWLGGVVPSALDAVVFGPYSISNCLIDTAVNVLNITIASGYTGTITQQANVSVTNDFSIAAGGTWDVAGHGVTVGHLFNNSGMVTSSAGDIHIQAGTIHSGAILNTSAAGHISLKTASGTLSVTNNITANYGIGLDSATVIDQSGGTIGSGVEELILSATQGITLNNTHVSKLQATNAVSGDINVTNAGSLILTSLDGSKNTPEDYYAIWNNGTGNVSITAQGVGADITLQGMADGAAVVDAKGNISLIADQDIKSGLLYYGALWTELGDILLQAGRDIAFYYWIESGKLTDGQIVLNAIRDISIGRIHFLDVVEDESTQAGTIKLTSGGVITQGAGGYPVVSEKLLVSAVQGITLGNTQVSQLQATNTASGNISITNTGALVLTNLDGSKVSAGEYYSILNQGSGNVSIHSTGDITLRGIDRGPGTMIVEAKGNVSLTTGGSITSDSLYYGALWTEAGNILLQAALNIAVTYWIESSKLTNGLISLIAGGNLSVGAVNFLDTNDNPTQAGTINLTAGGAVTQALGIYPIVSEKLHVSAASGITLNRLQVSSLEAHNTTSGNISITHQGDLTVTDMVNANAGGQLNLTVNGNLTFAGGTFTGTAGTVTVSGDFSQLSGTFTSNPNQTFSVGQSFSIADGAIFNRFTGAGTIGLPYVIYDVYGLQAMKCFLSSNFLLAGNIDASSTAIWNGGAGFNPVGYSTGDPNELPTNPFTGNFNGSSHAITGLTIDRAAEHFVGLFGHVGGGSSINCVGLINANITGNSYVGGLAGRTFGSIFNSYTTGTVNGGYFVGGLAGLDYSGAIFDSYSSSSVRGDSYVGGLSGRNRSSSISNSYFNGTVSGNGGLGGLVGLNESSPISNSYSTGTITGHGGGLTASSGDGSMITNSYFTDGMHNNGYGTYEPGGLSSFYGASHLVYDQSAANPWDFTNVWDSYNYALPHLGWEDYTVQYPVMTFYASGRMELRILEAAGGTDGNFYYHYEDTAANLCDWAKRAVVNADGEIAFSYFYYPGTSLVQFKDSFSDVARTQRLTRYEYDASGVLIAKTDAGGITSYFNTSDGFLERVALGQTEGAADPLPSIEIVRPVITQFANPLNQWTIKFDRAMRGVRYEVQYRTSLTSGTWQVAGEFVADHYGETVWQDSVPDRGNVVFYRIMAKEMTTAADLLTQINLLYFDPAFGMIEATHGYPSEGWIQRNKTQPSNFGFYAYLLATIAAGDLVTSKISKAEAISRLNTMMDHLLLDQADVNIGFLGLLPWLEYTGSDWQRMEGSYGHQVNFEDNTNFTNALAVAYGALLDETLAGNATVHGAGGVLGKINTFIANQEVGYFAMYDNTTNTFAQTMQISDRSKSGAIVLFGAESSAPLLFLILQYGDTFPASAYAKLNFATRTYRMQDLTFKTVVAPFSGAFQMYWPALLMPESEDPDLRAMIETYTDVQLDFANRNAQPGFLSASYDVVLDNLLSRTVSAPFSWMGDDVHGAWEGGGFRVWSPLSNAGIGVAFTDGSSKFALEGSTMQLRYSSMTAVPNARIEFKRLVGGVLTTVYTEELSLENTGGAECTVSFTLPLNGVLGELAEVVFATSGGGALDVTLYSFDTDRIGYNFPLGINEIATGGATVETTPSVYNLGAAYMFRPAQVEALLQWLIAAHPGLVSAHGLWEGLNMLSDKVVHEQVFNNVVTFALGMVGAGSSYMTRYLENKGMTAELESIWNSQAPVVLDETDRGLDFPWEGYTCTPWSLPENSRASERQIRLTYQSAVSIHGAKIELKHATSRVPIYTASFNLDATGDVPGEFILNVPADALYWYISDLVVRFPEAQGSPSAVISRIVLALEGVVVPPEVVVNAGTPHLINTKTLSVSYTVDGVLKTKLFENLLEGANTLAITAADVPGLQTPVTWNVTVDTIAPVVVLDSGTPSLITTTSLTVFYTVDGAAEQKTFSGLVEGANTLTVTGIDTAGNQTVVIKSVMVGRDLLRGPRAVFSPPGGGNVSSAWESDHLHITSTNHLEIGVAALTPGISTAGRQLQIRYSSSTDVWYTSIQLKKYINGVLTLVGYPYIVPPRIINTGGAVRDLIIDPISGGVPDSLDEIVLVMKSGGGSLDMSLYSFVIYGAIAGAPQVPSPAEVVATQAVILPEPIQQEVSTVAEIPPPVVSLSSSSVPRLNKRKPLQQRAFDLWADQVRDRSRKVEKTDSPVMPEAPILSSGDSKRSDGAKGSPSKNRKKSSPNKRLPFYADHPESKIIPDSSKVPLVLARAFAAGPFAGTAFFLFGTDSVPGQDRPSL